MRSVPFAALAFLIAGALPAQTAERQYTAVVHVPLEMPVARDPRPDSYCLGDRRPATAVPVPQALLLRYEVRLRSIGRVTERFGFGTWLTGASANDGVAFENDDHVFVTAPLPALERGLPPLLRQMRLELHQQETLAEFLATDAGPGERRVRLETVLPFERASYAALQKIHRIFGDAGRSGASQFDDRSGVHVYSSVAPDAVARIGAGLRSAGYAFTSSPSNFVTAVAPKCRNEL
ncbi:MAG: hypothetical protein WAN59_00415 [Candidatus Baltobacteraceae bacterium]|jgi:hypothetical protein